jgi:hypothetical protein
MFGIKKWLLKRKDMMNTLCYQRGFGWALEQYFSGVMCECELEMASDDVLFRGVSLYFDRGIKSALSIIYSLGVSDNEGYYKPV